MKSGRKKRKGQPRAIEEAALNRWIKWTLQLITEHSETGSVKKETFRKMDNAFRNFERVLGEDD